MLTRREQLGDLVGFVVIMAVLGYVTFGLFLTH